MTAMPSNLSSPLICRPFKQVDVFTARPYLGNPLAVVLDSTGLSDTDMQRLAHWTNLSETAFLLPPSPAARAAGADYRVRIFTPSGELPFAGHPTLGSCHVWLEGGGMPQVPTSIVQECGVGLVRIRRSAQQPGLLAFAAPPLKRSNPGPMQLAQIAAALGLKAHHIITAQLLDNGPTWLGLLLDSPATVLALNPDQAALKALGYKIGVAGLNPSCDTAEVGAGVQLIARSSREARAFAQRSASAAEAAAAQADMEVRAFAPSAGISEDPVTGSFNASLAQWLIADGHAPERYIASQGTCLGRAGRVHIERDAEGQVWVGGESVTCIEGHIRL